MFYDFGTVCLFYLEYNEVFSTWRVDVRGTRPYDMSSSLMGDNPEPRKLNHTVLTPFCALNQAVYSFTFGTNGTTDEDKVSLCNSYLKFVSFQFCKIVSL